MSIRSTSQEAVRRAAERRVFLHTHRHSGLWTVQYLEPDLRTSIGCMYHYTSLDRVREILDRANVSPEAREEFESGIRRWGIGACFLELTS